MDFWTRGFGAGISRTEKDGIEDAGCLAACGGSGGDCRRPANRLATGTQAQTRSDEAADDPEFCDGLLLPRFSV